MSGVLGRRAEVVAVTVDGRCFGKALRAGRDLRARPPDGIRCLAVRYSPNRHPHVLLAGGLQALDEIFPHFESDLVRAGAVSVRLAQDIPYERPDVGVLPKRDFGISMICASRPLIELVLRDRAEAIPNIPLRRPAAWQRLAIG